MPRKLPKKPKVSLRLQPGFLSTMFVVIAVVLVWRGLWGLLDLYFFPEDKRLSYILSALFGLAILYLPDEDIKELV